MDGQPSLLRTFLTPLVPLLLGDDLDEITMNPDGAVGLGRKRAVQMARVAHLKIDPTLSVNPGQAIASGKITRDAFSIRAQVIAAPVEDAGMVLTPRLFGSFSDQMIEPRLSHDRLADPDKHKRERATRIDNLARQGTDRSCATASRIG